MNEEINITENNGLKRVVYVNKKRTPSEKFRKKITHTYNRAKVFITKAGMKYNVYDRIQQFAHDTNFYRVLEDYNCTPDEAMERMKTRMTEIKGVMDFGKSYAEHLMNVEKAKKEFDMLPVKVKEHFKNNVKEFIENGEEYINNLIGEATKVQTEIKETE